VLPIFFQLIIAAIEIHPLQRPDCFDILCRILSFSLISPFDDGSSSGRSRLSKEAYPMISAHKDAIECLVFLMGQGFAMLPLSFIISRISSFDAVMVRHTLHLLLNAIRPPLSKSFALKLVDLFGTEVVRNAVKSIYFKEEDSQLLALFNGYILESI